MPLPGRWGHQEAHASAPQAPKSLLPDNAPLEFWVLLFACRVFLDTEEPAKLEALLRQGPEWEQLLALASRHGVMPLLYRSINQNCPQAVPAEWLARLRMQYMMNAARNMKMTAELLRLLDLFEQNGIEAIPFKGPALAKQVFGDIALRTFGDLDVIVHQEDVSRVKEILLKEGYQPEVQLNLAQEKLFLNLECEYNFTHPGRSIRIEIHWKLAPSCYSIDFDYACIWSRAITIELERQKVEALSQEDLLIALCVHGARHCWNFKPLRLIMDVSGILALQRDLDWEKVMKYSSELHAEGLLFVGLLLSKQFFATNLPEDISNRAESDHALERLTSSLVRLIVEDSQRPSRLIEELNFWLAARERNRDKLSCILRLAFEPNTIDWLRIALPASMYPLYYIIHPLRLTIDYGFKRRL